MFILTFSFFCFEKWKCVNFVFKISFIIRYSICLNDRKKMEISKIYRSERFMGSHTCIDEKFRQLLRYVRFGSACGDVGAECLHVYLLFPSNSYMNEIYEEMMTKSNEINRSKQYITLHTRLRSPFKFFLSKAVSFDNHIISPRVPRNTISTFHIRSNLWFIFVFSISCLYFFCIMCARHPLAIHIGGKRNVSAEICKRISYLFFLEENLRVYTQTTTYFSSVWISALNATMSDVKLASLLAVNAKRLRIWHSYSTAVNRCVISNRKKKSTKNRRKLSQMGGPHSK